MLDHGLDLIHPPVWYVAWAAGVPAGGGWLAPALMVTVVGYVIGRLIEGLFLLVFKTEIHCWRRIDSRFRMITARRNPNLILLTIAVLAGAPGLGLVVVAVWTAVSVGFHAVRLTQAAGERLRGRPVESWLEGGMAWKPTEGC